MTRRGAVNGAAAIAFIAVLATGKAWTHDAMPSSAMPQGWKFDGWCCNGDGNTGDCQQIPDTSVHAVAGGYEITLKPGEHRLVTKPHTYSKAQSDVRDAPDGRYYACLYPTEDILRCFYAPPMSY
jgi:hypothetical protein